LLAVSNRLTNLAHALCQRFIGYDDIGPDRLQQLILGHQAIWILHEKTQQLEALAAERNLTIPSAQQAARDIKRISLELEHLEPPPDYGGPSIISARFAAST
jgi:hypothetical protein